MTDPMDDLERTMRERLGAGARLDPARRESLLEKILGPVPLRRSAAAPRTRRGFSVFRFPYSVLGRTFWPWAALVAAAAAVVIGLAVHRALRPEPIPPTALLADLWGPFGAAAEARPAPPPPAAEEAPVGAALAALWQDLEGPVSIGQAVFGGPPSAAPPKAPVADDSKEQAPSPRPSPTEGRGRF